MTKTLGSLNEQCPSGGVSLVIGIWTFLGPWTSGIGASSVFCSPGRWPGKRVAKRAPLKPPGQTARATSPTVGMRCCASVDTHSVSLPKPPGPPARATSPMVGMRCCASVDTHSVSLPKPPGPPARATSPMVGMRCGASVDTHSVSLPKPPGPPARDTLFPSQFRLELKSFISGQLAHSAVLGGGVVAIDAVFFEHSHADEIVGGSH